MTRFGTILHGGAYLVQKVQPLFDLPLGVCRVGALLGRHGLTHDVSIAGVVVAKCGVTAIVRAGGTGDAVAHRTRLASATLTSLLLAAGALAAGLTTLTTLTGLAALTALTGLAALLALLARLPRLATLRWLLTGLAGLTGLPVAGELAGLELLAAGLAGTAGLTLPGLLVGTPAKASELVAQTG